MNTKASWAVGWFTYTAAYGAGAAYAIDRYWNETGGRREREAEADRIRAEQAAQEAIDEERIRQERRLAKQQAAAVRAEMEAREAVSEDRARPERSLALLETVAAAPP